MTRMTAGGMGMGSKCPYGCSHCADAERLCAEQISVAEKWPNFDLVKGDICAMLSRNLDMSLREAYLRTVAQHTFNRLCR